MNRAGMIWSVSISFPRIGIPLPSTVTTGRRWPVLGSPWGIELFPALLLTAYLLRRGSLLCYTAGCGSGSKLNSRTSTTSPETAAAATIAGLINTVRPEGDPCRPTKFLFEELAQS